MSQIVEIQSPTQFQQVLSSSTIVVTDFWATWCGPCKAIAPLYEQLSSQLSRPNKITFTKVDTDRQAQIAQSYNITAMPTFLVFKKGREVSRLLGADAKGLNEAVRKLAQEADGASSSSSGFGDTSSSGDTWLGAPLPRNYADVTDQVDVRGLDLLNVDSALGDGRTLFHASRPRTLAAEGKGKEKGTVSTEGGKSDWIESDTDEQVMLFIPFQSTLKVHTLHITSAPPSSNGDNGEAEEDVPIRPRTIRLYINRPNNLSFDEAEDEPFTQEVVLQPGDWDTATATAKLELRFVKFQRVTSLVMFVVDGEGDGDKVRLDRIRIIGEMGEKRAMGKLEKVGDLEGE
ncbi:MAG: hypothetical protein M1821_001065 [Bathelium mastoideum]|nr:MAG: hypothetical protein M1821_001065 [Bathelium mastoideum]KAI9693910.1 MAG: hypothetical protein M1822_003181 [Bathelium mastoideum]